MADDPVAAVLARIEELTVKRHALRADWLDIDAGELADVTEELLGWGDRSRAALEAVLASRIPADPEMAAASRRAAALLTHWQRKSEGADAVEAWSARLNAGTGETTTVDRWWRDA